MPISLTHLKNDKRAIVATYFGEEVNITYHPSALTPAVETAIREASEDGDNAVLVDTLQKLIVTWDVLEENGEPLPIVGDVLNNLPSAFLGAILQACREDMIPKSKNGRR